VLGLGRTEGSVEKDVSLVDADHSLDDEIDAAYRTKYDRYWYDRYSESTIRRITSPEARSTTMKRVPRGAGAP